MAYELIPHSGKVRPIAPACDDPSPSRLLPFLSAVQQVVVFDSGLKVIHAFNALLRNEINCAPVWDSEKHKYVGMLSVTDFIDILMYSWQHKEQTNKVLAAIQKQRICDWQSIKRDRGTSINRLLCISPECSLYECVRLLIEYRIHRLCVVQLALGNTVLCVLSHHTILRYLMKQVRLFLRVFRVVLVGAARQRIPCYSVLDLWLSPSAGTRMQ